MDVEFDAMDQLRRISTLPWTQMLRVMPDVHFGKGATVGSVIAMRDAVAPNAVGVDIGCGMIAVQSSLTLDDLPDNLHPLCMAIEAAVPVGFRGTGSYVVRGLGNQQSLNSASHGAGRRMSRAEAKRRFTADDLAQQTLGIECRKDTGVVDEIPGAYRDIDDVIAAQADLVEVVTRLSTLMCIKG